MTIEAQQRLGAGLAHAGARLREAMGTSAAQVCPLFDQTNTRKSVDEVLRLLECEVQFSVRAKSA